MKKTLKRFSIERCCYQFGDTDLELPIWHNQFRVSIAIKTGDITEYVIIIILWESMPQKLERLDINLGPNW